MNELLNRYFAGTLSDSEKRTFFLQLEHDQILKEEFVCLQNVMVVSSIIVHHEKDGDWTARKFDEMMKQANKRKFRRISLSILKYAAVAAIVVGVWIGYNHYMLRNHADNYTYIEAPKGQRVYVVLPDGTEVWLTSRTQLKVPRLFNHKERIVELDGEGFFSVNANKKKPFIVKTKEYNIQATGTQFNVFAYSKSAIFETDLIEGAVFVYNNKDNTDKRLYLSPNQKALVKGGQLQKSDSLFIQSQYIKNGIYSFENKLLKELVRRMELWYDVRITITKPEIGEYVFSGKFRQIDDIENILRAIKETGKFDYRIIDEQKIEIY